MLAIPIGWPICLTYRLIGRKIGWPTWNRLTGQLNRLAGLLVVRSAGRPALIKTGLRPKKAHRSTNQRFAGLQPSPYPQLYETNNSYKLPNSQPKQQSSHFRPYFKHLSLNLGQLSTFSHYHPPNSTASTLHRSIIREV
jgi:hypothetical protein